MLVWPPFGYMCLHAIARVTDAIFHTKSFCLGQGTQTRFLLPSLIFLPRVSSPQVTVDADIGCVCISAGPSTKLCPCGEEDSGGHVPSSEIKNMSPHFLSRFS